MGAEINAEQGLLGANAVSGTVPAPSSHLSVVRVSLTPQCRERLRSFSDALAGDEAFTGWEPGRGLFVRKLSAGPLGVAGRELAICRGC